MTLKNPCPTILLRLSVNHAVNKSAKRICGIKFSSHITTVLDNACLKDGFVKTVLKFRNGSSVRKWKLVIPRPFKSVNPIITVYTIGYKVNNRNATAKGILK